MPRKPKPGDYIPSNLITDETMLNGLRALAMDQNPDFGTWRMRGIWDSLVYTIGGSWSWRNLSHNTLKSTFYTPCTPDDFLGPEPKPLTPGSWVERKDSIKNEWVKRWFVGYNSEGKLITEHGKHPDEFLTNNPDQVRPYRDTEQRAIDKLYADQRIVTKEMVRTVKLLNTLGLLKD